MVVELNNQNTDTWGAFRPPGIVYIIDSINSQYMISSQNSRIYVN